MLFITNRFPKGSIRTRINRKFSFDLNNNAASNSVFFCRRNAKNDYTEIGSKALLQELRDGGYEQILITIHGFANLPEKDIFQATAELQTLLNAKKPNQVFVLPMIWPCDNDLGIVGDYWDDQRSADQSAFSFARVLQKFMDWRRTLEDEGLDPCLKRINLLSHSMGNRVLRETLAAWRKYDHPGGLPLLFRNVFMVAADIVNESLHEGESGELITHAARNVVVYYASDDLALRASKASNLKNGIASRRLGHSGPENMELTPKNVYAVDCDDINTQYDYPKGHSYFRYDKSKNNPGVVFKHIYACIDSGRVFPDDEFRRTTILSD